MSKQRLFAALAVVAIVLTGIVAMAASGDIWALRNGAGVDVLRVTSTGDLVPGVDNTYDLGTSALSWNDANIQGTATLGTAGVTGNATVGGTLGVTGVSTFTGATIHNGDVTLGNALADSIDINGTADFASVRFSGYINGTIKDTADSYTVIAGTDHFVTVSNTDADRTVYLPTAAAVGPGGIIIVKDKSGAANTHNITVEGAGDETVDGSANKAITTAYGALRLITDGTNWLTF